MEFEYFENTDSEASVHKEYKKLAKKYHPDKAKSEDEKENFHTIMQDINREYQDILVLIKYQALNSNRKSKNNKNLSGNKNIVQETIKETINLLKLKEEQQDILINKGKDALNFLYESWVGNLKGKMKSSS